MGFDRPKYLGTGDRLIARIQFPQRPNKANGSARSVELKLVFRWLCKMNISGSGRETRPPETIGRAQGRSSGKFPAGSLLSVASQFSASELEQNVRNAKIAGRIRNRIRIDIFSGRNRPAIVRLSYGSLLFIRTKKIHASLARVYFRIVEFKS